MRPTISAVLLARIALGGIGDANEPRDCATNLLAAAVDPTNDGLQRVLHAVEGTRHFTDFVIAVNDHARAQAVAALYLGHGITEVLYIATDEMEQPLRAGQHAQHQHEHDTGVTAGLVDENGEEIRIGRECLAAVDRIQRQQAHAGE